MTRQPRFEPATVGWRIGTAHEPRGRELWCPWDRTAGVIGPQGSGKTLDLLTPALLSAPGAALVTLTKVDDLLLTITARSAGGRPCAVLDPFTKDLDRCSMDRYFMVIPLTRPCRERRRVRSSRPDDPG